MTRIDELILKVLELSVYDDMALKTELTELIGQVDTGVPDIQDMTESAATLQPNILYNFGSVPQLNLTFGGAERSDLYHFRFMSSTADFTLSYASESIVYKGVTDFVAGTVYEGSLVDGLLIVY